MRRCILTALAICVCIAAVAGCKKKAEEGAMGGPAQVKRATTPEQTFKNMQAALLAGDKVAFVECFDVSGREADMLGAIAEFVGVSIRFEQAMKKAYGEDALRSSQRSEPLEAWKKSSSLEGAKITIEGDTATVTKAGEATPLHLVRREGVWRIRAGEFLGGAQAPGGQDLDAAVKMLSAMTKALKSVMTRIGEPGYSAEKINREVGAAMMAAMLEAARQKQKEKR